MCPDGEGFVLIDAAADGGSADPGTVPATIMTQPSMVPTRYGNTLHFIDRTQSQTSPEEP